MLRRNDAGGWTRAAPNLYPHQWSWDSAFIAISLAHLDVDRAAGELTNLFAHQWSTGKVPHIVFDPEAPPGSYFPGAEHWASEAESPDRPSMPAPTSGLCQPPVHAIAAWHVWETAGLRGGDAPARTLSFLEEIYPKLFSWHRYLATMRDPEESGLVTIYHPWESGTDNSPRWNAALERVPVGSAADHASFSCRTATSRARPAFVAIRDRPLQPDGSKLRNETFRPRKKEDEPGHGGLGPPVCPFQLRAGIIRTRLTPGAA